MAAFPRASFDGVRVSSVLHLALGLVLPLLLIATGVAWFIGSTNPYTPAGYVGYLTKGAVFGRSSFYGTQRGPTSAGRHWLLRVANVSVTPYTYSEDFVGDDAVLSRDNLKIGFKVHTVWRVDDRQVPLFMERFSTIVSNRRAIDDPDALVRVAYGNFIREPLRTFARDEVQRRNGLEVKDALVPIATAVSQKLAATQDLQRKDTEIEIERKERTKREVQAQGIANAMQIIRGQLNALYIQHEAIEAQKLMVNSPNHTVVYIPVGPMGVPVTAAMPSTQTAAK